MAAVGQSGKVDGLRMPGGSGLRPFSGGGRTYQIILMCNKLVLHLEDLGQPTELLQCQHLEINALTTWPQGKGPLYSRKLLPVL